MPWQSFWAILSGGVLVVAGATIFFGARVRVAAITLGAMLLLNFLWLHMPRALGDPLTGFMWTNPSKNLALFGGTILLAASGVARNWKPRITTTLLPVAPLLLGIFLFICGVQHFVYAGFVDTLVPAWISPGARFWTLFTGVALMAGGVGLVIPPTIRLAAMLSGLMVFLWVILLHIPRAVSEANQASELAGVFEALAVTGVALMIAGAFPGTRGDGAFRLSVRGLCESGRNLRLTPAAAAHGLSGSRQGDHFQ